MTAHTPRQLADLARAALPAMMLQRKSLKTEQEFTEADHAHYKFQEACTPATILALVERLEEQFYSVRGCHTECECDLSVYKKEAMTTPLTPEARP